ncbi:MAG: DUF4194 domain-containing protein [Magnetococcales bacterium]|nr:DUF4194 domain-containing protein [Magnetococcales bacterium]
MEEQQNTSPATGAATDADLSQLVVTLLKGVIYREEEARLWGALFHLQARVRDHVAVLGLELIFDEAEGYAFLRSKPDAEEDVLPKIPRLVVRRPLSFPVSLLLALLRKKLAEFDASGGDTRLVLSRDDVAELMRVFLPDSSNEVKLIGQIETYINRIVALGFLRPLKVASGPAHYEVRRILKAFVDAQWLNGFDTRLAEYQTRFTKGSEESGGTEDE